jgi:MFS family permease
MAPLVAGTLVLILGNILLASGSGLLLPAVGIVCWGLHLGLTQGILSAMIADTAPVALKATAFGLLNLVSGLGLLAASLIAGALWDRVGSSAMFLAAVIPAAGVLLLLGIMGGACQERTRILLQRLEHQIKKCASGELRSGENRIQLVRPDAGPDASVLPASSPTVRIGETRPRDGRVVATRGGPAGRALREQASTNAAGLIRKTVASFDNI